LKDLLTAVAFIALCGVSLAGAYRVWQCELPERSPDELRELWDLLTNEDISDYDDRALGRLAGRLEMELARGTSLRRRFRELNADRDVARYDLLEGNLEALLRVWFFKHVDAYAGLAGEQARAAYIDDQIGNISMLLSAADYGGGDVGGANALLRFLGLVETWLADEPPPREAQAREFLEAVRAGVMDRRFRALRGP
jgi:hypothetical protein